MSRLSLDILPIVRERGENRDGNNFGNFGWVGFFERGVGRIVSLGFFYFV